MDFTFFIEIYESNQAYIENVYVKHEPNEISCLHFLFEIRKVYDIIVDVRITQITINLLEDFS